MAVLLRDIGGTDAVGTSHVFNYPASITAGEIVLMWVVVPTGISITTPAGWVLEASGDDGAVKASLFSRTYVSGASVTVTTGSSDAGYVMVSIRSSAPSPTIGFGQGGYTGTGTEPGDASNTYTYSASGKKNVDTSSDTVLGVFSGGIMCDTDVPLYFYALAGASASTVTLGGDDTSLEHRTLPTATTITFGCITSEFKANVGRGFTRSVTGTDVAFGTWASENVDTSGGGGPGGNGSVNFPPATYTYQAIDNDKPARKSARVNGGWYFSTGSMQHTEGRNAPGKRGTVERGDGRASLVQSAKETVQPQFGGGITLR